MKTIPDSLTPEQAWQRLSACEQLVTETLPLSGMLDHCLGEDFTVFEDVPAAPRSFMDGYAVHSPDLTLVPVRLKVIGEILMGEASLHMLHPGEAMAIPTGGYLPPGADAVVMQEDTELLDGTVLVRRKLERGENVQALGEDFRRGQVLLSAGRRLRPQDLAAMATFGLTEASVVRRPVLRVISTGNELVPPGSKAPPGKIHETNSLALTTAARKFGFECEAAGIVVDELPAQREAVEHALAECDVVLVSGGSSVGERDYTIPVIESFAINRIHFHGLAIRPGNPTIFGSIGNRFIFGLPGQPVSSLAVFYQFVLPFLYHLSGETVDYAAFNDLHFRSVTARLTQSVKPLRAKTDYVRLSLSCSGGEWRAVPVLGKSASLSTLVLAHGFTIVRPGDSPLPEGAEVTVYLFP